MLILIIAVSVVLCALMFSAAHVASQADRDSPRDEAWYDEDHPDEWWNGRGF